MNLATFIAMALVTCITTTQSSYHEQDTWYITYNQNANEYIGKQKKFPGQLGSWQYYTICVQCINDPNTRAISYTGYEENNEGSSEHSRRYISR